MHGLIRCRPWCGPAASRSEVGQGCGWQEQPGQAAEVSMPQRAAGMLQQPMTAGWSQYPVNSATLLHPSWQVGCSMHASSTHTHAHTHTDRHTRESRQVAGLHCQVAQNAASTAGMGEGPTQPRLGCQHTLLPLPPPPLNMVGSFPRQRRQLDFVQSDNYRGRKHASMDIQFVRKVTLHQCSSTVSAAVCNHAHRRLCQEARTSCSSLNTPLHPTRWRHSESWEVSFKDW